MIVMGIVKCVGILIFGGDVLGMNVVICVVMCVVIYNGL